MGECQFSKKFLASEVRVGTQEYGHDDFLHNGTGFQISALTGGGECFKWGGKLSGGNVLHSRHLPW